MNPSILLVNPMRKKQPYLVNPPTGNPWRAISVPKHRYAVWQDRESGRFAKPPKAALARKRSFQKAHHIKIKPLARKLKAAAKRVKRKLKRAVKKAAPSVAPAKKVSVKSKPSRAKGARKMARRKTARKGRKTRRNDWPGQPRRHRAAAKKGWRRGHKIGRKLVRRNPPAFALGQFVPKTDMLVDGAYVAGGMFASKILIDFVGARVPLLSTPVGKIVGRVFGGTLVSQSYRVGVPKNAANMLAIGFIAPAVLDVAEMVLPRLGYAGGVRLLGAGYMPVRSQIEGGYMPDVEGVGSGYMPDVSEGENYGMTE